MVWFDKPKMVYIWFGSVNLKMFIFGLVWLTFKSLYLVWNGKPNDIYIWFGSVNLKMFIFGLV